MIGKWRLAWGLSSERFGVVTRLGFRAQKTSEFPQTWLLLRIGRQRGVG